MTLKAVIFDMDGVLVNTEAVKFHVYKEVFRRKFGVEIKETTERLGKDEAEVMQMFLDKNKLRGDSKELVKEKNNLYYQTIPEGVMLVRGVREFINSLSERCVIMAVATTSEKKSADILLSSFDLKKFFDVILTKEDVVHHKPHPDVYIKTAKKLGVEPNDCVVIEDAPAGIESAHGAGMKCIAITTSAKREKLSKADLIIDKFSELNFHVLEKVDRI